MQNQRQRLNLKGRYFVGASLLLMLFVQIAMVGPVRAAADAIVVLNDVGKTALRDRSRSEASEVAAIE